MQSLDKAIQLDPKSVFSYYYKGNLILLILGLCLNCLFKYEEAIEMFDFAIQLDPTYPYAYNSKG